MSSTLIFYHIPEDCDDQEEPNAYSMDKPIDQITLLDIKTSFPVEGTYQFRFKVIYNKVSVWLDIDDDTGKIPQYSNMIIIRATRLSWYVAPEPAPPEQLIHF